MTSSSRLRWRVALAGALVAAGGLTGGAVAAGAATAGQTSSAQPPASAAVERPADRPGQEGRAPESKAERQQRRAERRAERQQRKEQKSAEQQQRKAGRPPGPAADGPAQPAVPAGPAFVCDPALSHGQNVSAYARSLPEGPGRGRLVSQAARSDCGKPSGD